MSLFEKPKVEIESNIPPPRKNEKWISTLEKMKIGDSFFLAKGTEPIARSVYFCGRRKGIKIAWRKQQHETTKKWGVRIWRVS